MTSSRHPLGSSQGHRLPPAGAGLSQIFLLRLIPDPHTSLHSENCVSLQPPWTEQKHYKDILLNQKHVMKLISIFSGMNKKCNLTKNATLAICASIGIDRRVFCSWFSPAFLVIQGPRHTIGIGYIDSYFTNAVQSRICYFQKLFMSADILSINIMAIIDPNSLKNNCYCYWKILNFRFKLSRLVELNLVVTFIVGFITRNVSFVEVGLRTQITSKLWCRVFTIANLFDFSVNFTFAVINANWFPVTPSSRNYISIIVKFMLN